MNTNFYVMKVIQDEKVKEFQDFSDQVRLINLVSKKEKDTRNYKSILVEKLLKLQTWLTFEFRSLKLSSR